MSGVPAAKRRNFVSEATIDAWWLVSMERDWEGGWRDTPVYRREALPETAEFEGPAIVEQLDTTVVVEPGFLARRDAMGNLLLESLGRRHTGEERP